MKNFLIWDKYDNKYREVVDFKEVKETESELYEANNRINDLLDLVKQKDKMIQEMIKVIIDSGICDYFIKQHCVHYAGENKKTCDNCLKEYFEKRCK